MYMLTSYVFDRSEWTLLTKSATRLACWPQQPHPACACCVPRRRPFSLVLGSVPFSTETCCTGSEPRSSSLSPSTRVWGRLCRLGLMSTHDEIPRRRISQVVFLALSSIRQCGCLSNIGCLWVHPESTPMILPPASGSVSQNSVRKAGTLVARWITGQGQRSDQKRHVGKAGRCPAPAPCLQGVREAVSPGSQGGGHQPGTPALPWVRVLLGSDASAWSSPLRPLATGTAAPPPGDR